MGLRASGVKKQNNNNKDSQGRFDMSRVVDSQLLCLIGLQSLNLVSDIATLKKKRKEGQKDTIKTKQAKKWFANKYWLWLPIQDKKKMKKKKKKRGKNNNNKNLDCFKKKRKILCICWRHLLFLPEHLPHCRQAGIIIKQRHSPHPYGWLSTGCTEPCWEFNVLVKLSACGDGWHFLMEDQLFSFECEVINWGCIKCHLPPPAP